MLLRMAVGNAEIVVRVLGVKGMSVELVHDPVVAVELLVRPVNMHLVRNSGRGVEILLVHRVVWVERRHVRTPMLLMRERYRRRLRTIPAYAHIDISACGIHLLSTLMEVQGNGASLLG